MELNRPYIIEHYKFSNFVSLESNDEALSLAKIAAFPFNKGFCGHIGGPTGVGKTHLFHAVAHEWKRRAPKTKIVCVTTDRFINEYYYASRSSVLKNFAAKYTQCDLFLLESIEYLSARASYQTLLLEILQSLHSRGTTILTSSVEALGSDPENMHPSLVTAITSFETAFIKPLSDPELRECLIREFDRKDLNVCSIATESLLVFLHGNNHRVIQGICSLLKTKYGHQKIEIEHAKVILDYFR